MSSSVKVIGVGDISQVSGEIIIAGRDVYKGYTVEEVSTLIAKLQSAFQPQPFDGRCPYKGLEVFEEGDADLFFGRERVVEDLVRRVTASRAVFVTGPSGSGKSSLVRAGLIPALRKGELQALHSERWVYATIKPGRDPVEALALAFSRLKSPELAEYFRTNVDRAHVLNACAESTLSEWTDQRFVLFIDQFEEIFTQINGDEQRLAFLNVLSDAVFAEHGRVILLFAMRSDFVSNCAIYPALNVLLNQPSAFAQIGAMQRHELVSAIAQPALRVGLRIDPDLIAQIINDMQGEPGALPLMQFALKDLFIEEQSRGGVITLTLDEYTRRGGIYRSLERHADGAFMKLSPKDQELARSIFGSLVEIGRGTQDTRRTALFYELVPAGVPAADVHAVVQQLADARLITTDEEGGNDTVTISHETLIDAWPWLRRLVNENREAIALQNQIAEDASQWETSGRDPSYLYLGARLANAREQMTARKILVSESVQEFLDAAIILEESRREQEQARMQKELDAARQLAETMQARLQAERRARRGLLVLTVTFALLATIALALLARPFVLRAMARGDMVPIPAGPVIIGTNDPEAVGENPEWQHSLDAFQIDRYEVSNYRYGLCVQAGTCDKPHDPTQFNDPDYADLPVAGVTAFQADTFCRWLGKRLPTELEWERAARGPEGRVWPWGQAALSYKYANMPLEDSTAEELLPVDTHPDGASLPPEQVFNLIGNVWEWTSSYGTEDYHGYDPQAVWDSSTGGPGNGLVQRGGAWDDDTLTRVTFRDSILANDDTRQVGIRCAKNQ